MTTFHIRAPMPRPEQVNRWYPSGSSRQKQTLCGAATTDHDIRFSWQAFSIGEYQPCEACCTLRKQQQRGTT